MSCIVLPDEFVARKDNVCVREVMELHVLPVENTAELVQRLVQVRSQYAVILGSAGEHKRAESDMRRLEPYFEGLTGYQQQEVEDQSTIITDLAFEALLSKSTKYSGPAGRNEPCPCGSGEKYKNVMEPDRWLNYFGRGLEMFRNGRVLSPREHAWMLPTPCNRALFISISVDSLKVHRRAWGSIWPAKAGHKHLGGRKYVSVQLSAPS